MSEALVKRNQKVAFYGVEEDGKTVFCRMTGFTEMAKTANPKEYARQYVDEAYERKDIVGYSPEYAFSFDMFLDNAVHGDIAAICDEEKLGSDAVRSIVIVDMTQAGADGAYPAVKRDFSVVADREGDSTDAYTYSGSLKVCGDKIVGTARSTDGFMTVTFQ
ncbi:MAG: hypothetical protein IJO50_05150 [Clostridia bacterium]|nr:hypothetical protein [Clostridia bacterium]